MPEPDPNTIVCKCGAELGQIIQADGVQLIKIGAVVVEELHGRCIQCGAGVHTSMPRGAYIRLMRHYGAEFQMVVEISAPE